MSESALPRVLVVDDEPSIRLLVQRLRRSPGVTAFCSAEVTAGWVER